MDNDSNNNHNHNSSNDNNNNNVQVFRLIVLARYLLASQWMVKCVPAACDTRGQDGVTHHCHRSSAGNRHEEALQCPVQIPGQSTLMCTHHQLL